MQINVVEYNKGEYNSAGQNVQLLTLSAVLSFVGPLVKRGTRAFSAALSFVGSILRGRLLSGVVNSGADVEFKRLGKGLNHTITFSSTMQFFISHVLFGSIHPFSFTRFKIPKSTLAGMLSFSGLIGRLNRIAISATISFVGSVLKRIYTFISGVVSYSRAVSAYINNKILDSALLFSSVVNRRAGISSVSGLLSLSGEILRGRVIDGVISFAGALSRLVGKGVSGVASFVGVVGRSISRALIGAVSASSQALKQSAKFLTAQISWHPDALVKQAIKSEFLGSISFTGVIHKFLSLARARVSGSISVVGGIAKVLSREIGGYAYFAASMIRFTNKKLIATGSFLGDTQRQTRRLLESALSFLGELVRLPVKFLVASLELVSNLVRQSRKALVADLFLGVYDRGMITKLIIKPIQASLTLSGQVVKIVSRILTGAVVLLGLGGVTRAKVVDGILSFSSTVQVTVMKMVSGILSCFGVGGKMIQNLLSGSIGFSGIVHGIVVKFVKVITGSLGFVGGAIVTLYGKAVGGVISFSGFTLQRLSNLIIKFVRTVSDLFGRR